MAGMKGRLRFATIALGALIVFAGTTMTPTPAKAWFGFGWGYGYPCCAAPYPYAPYPYPPAYYPPPPPAPYYPPVAYAAPAAPAAAAAAQPTAITYTSKPAFKNAAGQTCREFKTASNTLGTACQDASGQWRVSN
ncbi:MAG TPA: hypothetical protein VGG57_01030 [Stellaceae bacterium]